MTYQNLITQIKAEARIAGDATFDPIVIDLINEMFKEAVENERPFELRTSVDIPIAAVTGLAPLPADFLLHHEIKFWDADTDRTYPLVDEDKPIQPAPPGMYGHPKSFEIQGADIQVKPIDALVTGDELNLVYYKKPPILSSVGLGVENPISRLEPYLVRTVVRRLRMLHSDDIQVANMLGGDVSAAAQAYTHDEPERTERPNTRGS